jgi:hypothetical protein
LGLPSDRWRASASGRAEALNQAIALEPDVSSLARLMPTGKPR